MTNDRVLPVILLTILAAAGSATAQQRKAQPPNSVRLYVFDCGNLNIPDTSNYQLKKEELATTYMALPCYLVAHPKGTLMWDVGAVPDSSFKPGGGPATLRYASFPKPLTAQLAEIGYAPADITYLSFSHFHWDHVGNANVFAKATWLVRKLERDIMFSDPPSPRTEPANYSALKNSKTVIVTKDEHDVFGDGTVVIKSAPGHSPGPSGVVFEAGENRPDPAQRRSLSLSGGADAQQGPDHGIQRRANCRVESRRRGIPEENRRPALDPARLHGRCQAQEGACVLRMAGAGTGLCGTFSGSWFPIQDDRDREGAGFSQREFITNDWILSQESGASRAAASFVRRSRLHERGRGTI